MNMRVSVPTKHMWIGWMFSTAGVLLSGPGLFLRSQLGINDWTVRLLVDSERRHSPFASRVSDYLIVLFLLCLVTGWGLIRYRRWSRWAGIVASIGLLPLFPWFTLAGAAGLWVLLSDPPPTHDSGEDFSRLRLRQSPWQWAIGFFTISLWILACGRLTLYARTLGLPAPGLGEGFWGILFIGEFVVICVHELGHALAAWAVGFRFQSICVGPFITLRDAHENRHFRFDWKRFPLGGGYMGSVPTSERSLRLNQILVIFAGPFASLNAGLLLFLVFLGMRGSGWEAHWRIAGFTSLLFACDFIGNLIPLGYTDGTLLLHLLLWTRKGREYSSAWLSGKHAEEAVRSSAQTDYGEAVEMHRRVLDEALAHGDRPSVELAMKYQALGLAQLAAIQVEDAERSLVRSVDIFGQCQSANPLMVANSWFGLHQVYLVQRRAQDMRKASERFLLVIEKSKEKLSRAELFQALAAQASLHLNAGEYAGALRQIEPALALCPSGGEHLLRKALLLAQQAECEFQLGRHETALEAVAEAVEILCSDRIHKPDRLQAINTLGVVGVAVWNSGRNQHALGLFSECVRLLEQHRATVAAARYRVLSAELLRKWGRLTEAEAVLPADESLPQYERHAVVVTRAQIRLSSGRITEAVADAELGLFLQKERANAVPNDVATAECLLAECLLYDRRLDQSEALARQACDVLLASSHPNGASALIILALIRRERSHGSPEVDAANTDIDAALRIIIEDPLMKNGSRARGLEWEADGLEHFGWVEKASQYRAAAEAQWNKIGATSPHSVTAPAWSQDALASVTLKHSSC